MMNCLGVMNHYDWSDLFLMNCPDLFLMNCSGLFFMNCLRLKPEGPALLLRLEPKSKKFPILAASAKAFRNRSDFIFWLKPTLAPPTSG